METGLKNNFSEAFKPDARNEAIMSIIIIFMNIVIFTINGKKMRIHFFGKVPF